MLELKITYRDPNDLKDYENNARTHTEAQIEEIIASIKEFGFIDPIGIDGDDAIVEGHGRKMAAIKLGLSTVPTVSLAHLSERQRRAYILAHNRIALNAGWDMDKLSSELNALVDMDVDLTITGFDEQEIDAMLKVDPSLLPNGSPVKGADETTAGEGKSKAKSKILHKCPSCGHEFTAA